MTVSFLFALAAFLIGIIVHLMVMVGGLNVPLYVAFAVFFPAMVGGIAANTHVIAQRHRDLAWLPPGEFWSYITRNAPGWMRSLQVGLILYAVFNFYFTMLVINQGGYPRIMESGYALVRHKEIIEMLTYSEYLWHAGFVVRMLSSLVIAVYFGAITRWVARWRTVEAEQPQAIGEQV